MTIYLSTIYYGGSLINRFIAGMGSWWKTERNISRFPSESSYRANNRFSFMKHRVINSTAFLSWTARRFHDRGEVSDEEILPLFTICACSHRLRELENLKSKLIFPRWADTMRWGEKGGEAVKQLGDYLSGRETNEEAHIEESWKNHNFWFIKKLN